MTVQRGFALVLYLLAVVVFLLAAFGVEGPMQLVPLGLAFGFGAMLVESV